MEYNDLNCTKAYKELLDAPKASVKALLGKERIEKNEIKLGGGLKYNWAAMPIDENICSKLQALADEMDIVEKYKKILRIICGGFCPVPDRCAGSEGRGGQCGDEDGQCGRRSGKDHGAGGF